MQIDFEARYRQLEALKKEYPNIITSLTKKDYKGAATMTINKRGFVSIGYNQFGFFVNDGDDHFYGKYYKTAEEAFDELNVWMHKHGYMFVKSEERKVIDIGPSAVERIPAE